MQPRRQQVEEVVLDKGEVRSEGDGLLDVDWEPRIAGEEDGDFVGRG